MTLDDWIRRSRLSNADTADRLGCSVSAVAHWRGGTIPSAAFIAAIHRLTDGQVTANDFFGHGSVGGDAGERPVDRRPIGVAWGEPPARETEAGDGVAVSGESVHGGDAATPAGRRRGKPPAAACAPCHPSPVPMET